MLIARWKIKEILKKQKERDFMDSGYSPSLVYGCFEGLGVERTEDICEKCKSYFHCESYLRAVEIRINPFNKK